MFESFPHEGNLQAWTHTPIRLAPVMPRQYPAGRATSRRDAVRFSATTPLEILDRSRRRARQRSTNLENSDHWPGRPFMLERERRLQQNADRFDVVDNSRDVP